jgi:hypothetical protein
MEFINQSLKLVAYFLTHVDLCVALTLSSSTYVDIRLPWALVQYDARVMTTAFPVKSVGRQVLHK